MPAETLYQPLISPQSRRLRVIGLVLLAMVIGLCAYGGKVLMPKLRENRAPLHAYNARAMSGASQSPLTPEKAENLRRLVKTQLLFVYAYWGVCFVMILALFVVAYLDFREVSRNYLRLKVSLLAESARSASLPQED